TRTKRKIATIELRPLSPRIHGRDGGERSRRQSHKRVPRLTLIPRGGVSTRHEGVSGTNDLAPTGSAGSHRRVCCKGRAKNLESCRSSRRTLTVKGSVRRSKIVAYALRKSSPARTPYAAD